jgi:hypothetical protein
MRTHTRGLSCLLAVCLATPAAIPQTQADDTATVKHLEVKGAKITTVRGALSVTVGDCSRWTEADYKALGSLTRVTNLSFGPGFTEQALPLLAGLTELEALATNGMQVSDDGVKALAQFKKLRRLAFFHPSRTFTGVGLARLADLKDLEELTVAGSFAVNNDGLAAISKLKGLKQLRVWHAGNTDEGVQRLKELPALEALTLGQRLTYQPPPCPGDRTIALLLEIKSLKTLVLQESRFSREALGRLKQLPELRQLTLDGVDLSDADFEGLKKDLPHVRVTLTRPTEAGAKRIDALFGKR